MTISAHTQTYTRSSSRSKSPDEVPPEFPGRHNEPGPDDAYDPDTNNRGRSDYEGPHYYDTDTSGGGGWVLF
ncbi:hypothetical protein IV102_30240 [bacterium]|nr:hypothetical protein [bacterium]